MHVRVLRYRNQEMTDSAYFDGKAAEAEMKLIGLQCDVHSVSAGHHLSEDPNKAWLALGLVRKNTKDISEEIIVHVSLVRKETSKLAALFRLERSEVDAAFEEYRRRG